MKDIQPEANSLPTPNPEGSSAQPKPMAWRIQHGDFRHFSGAVATGRDYAVLREPDINRYYDGCKDLRITPLVPAHMPAHKAQEAGLSYLWDLIQKWSCAKSPDEARAAKLAIDALFLTSANGKSDADDSGCGLCDGDGAIYGHDFSQQGTCPRCKGASRLQTSSASAFNAAKSTPANELKNGETL